jgi:hypothetical protein
VLVQRGREELDPDVVAVVRSREIREPRVALELGLVDPIDVKRWIRHDEVKPPEAFVEILVVAVAFTDRARQPVQSSDLRK